ncbi:hypothetical protein RND71_014293 [Anisodus tanguticus]|uniref:Uncharacterized protein n=1 Tax=Anisodus tanguticus TaxID=243964 RepID=A0AAE1VE13_9SOLA|nr:hypothetical protein RND71_014293 [Anisodus tanguticus]
MSKNNRARSVILVSKYKTLLISSPKNLFFFFFFFFSFVQIESETKLQVNITSKHNT